MNDLFSILVGSNIFLLSFLLTGVLTDFKEAEKIPSNLATKIHSLYLEINANKSSKALIADIGKSAFFRININVVVKYVKL